MRNAGCGPTCLAEALCFFGKPTSPPEMADYCVKHGYRVPGNGTKQSAMIEVPKAAGLKSIPTSIMALTETLTGDNIAILHASGKHSRGREHECFFTKRGHYIVAYRFEGGGFQINDPGKNDKRPQNGDVPLQIILENVDRCWLISR
jgi:hypothetical protein